jgi:diguanylate cyclase (GGDEF)-like protein
MDKSRRKIHRSLDGRLTALILIMMVTISSTVLVIGYIRFKQSSEDYYWRLGEATAGVISLSLDADSLDGYLRAGEPDDEYYLTLATLRAARDECGALTLYVFTVDDAKEGILYVYDTDSTDILEDLGSPDPFYYIDEETGESELLYPDAIREQLIAGGNVDTIMGITYWGWTITVTEPLYGSDGTVKGYVGLDFDVNQVIHERTTSMLYLTAIILVVTILFSIAYLYIIRRTITHPINQIAHAADNFVVHSLASGESAIGSEILSLHIHTGDELQSLAESFQSMVQKIDEHLTNLSIVTKKSQTDVLTTICNRGAFEQQITALLNLRPEKDQLDVFMMIDVDFFKAVNDNYGHSAGDEVLTKCALGLKRIMREADVVGRIGGDEFGVFCKGIGSIAMAEEKAQKIREEWLKIIPPGGTKPITGSIGISFAPFDGSKYQELFDKADSALYVIKAAGRDGYATTQGSVNSGKISKG